MSARALVVTVTVGFVPPPAVIGAVHTLSSVLSEALKPLTFVYVLPAESVTPDALGLPAPHTPTCTTSRLPVGDVGRRRERETRRHGALVDLLDELRDARRGGRRGQGDGGQDRGRQKQRGDRPQ